MEFSKTVQAVTESSGTEIKPGELWDVFSKTYLPDDAGMRLISSEIASGGEVGENVSRVTAQVLVDGHHRTLSGQGNGPLNALVNALRDELGLEMNWLDYSQHALTAGSEASAVAYVEVAGADGKPVWGVGMDSSILDASLRAVIAAADRLRGQG
jgi:2-isopropylmalate synthase